MIYIATIIATFLLYLFVGHVFGQRVLRGMWLIVLAIGVAYGWFTNPALAAGIALAVAGLILFILLLVGPWENE